MKLKIKMILTKSEIDNKWKIKKNSDKKWKKNEKNLKNKIDNNESDKKWNWKMKLTKSEIKT